MSVSNNEIFTTEEKKILKKRKDGKEISPEKYERLLQASKEKLIQYESIETALDELEKKTSISIEKKVDEKIRLIEKILEEEQEKKEAPTEKINKAINEKQEELKDKFKEKIRKIPLVGDLLVDAYDWIEESKEESEDDSFFDKQKKKLLGWLGGIILGFFGYNKLKDKLTKTADYLSGKLGVVNGKVEEIQSENEVIYKPKISPEIIKEGYYLGGARTLISLSREKIKEKDAISSVLIHPNIKNISYKSLISLKTKTAREKKLGDGYENYEGSLEKIVNGFSNDATLVLLNDALKKDRILEAIKLDNGEINPKLYKLFGEERLKEILGKIEKGNLDWKDDLSLQEISIFYLESISVLGALGYTALKGGTKNLSSDLNTFFDTNNSQIKEIISQKTGELIPLDIIKAFNSKGLALGGNPLIMSDNLVLGENGIINNLEKPEDKETLKKLVKFKDYLLNSFVGENKILLDDSVFAEAFKKGLDYRWVILFYTIMNGKKELSSISATNLAMLHLTIGHVIDKENTTLGAEYMTNIGKEVLNDSSSIFTEEEKQIIKIYLKKLESVYLMSKQAQIASILGIGNSFNDNYTLSTILIGTGLSASYLGGKMEQKSHKRKGKNSRIGGKLRGLGIILAVTGVLSAGSKMYSGNIKQKYLTDLEEAPDFDSKLLIMEKFKDSITKKIIEVDGDKKEVTFVNYEGEIPFVIYDEAIWLYEVGGLDDYKFQEIEINGETKKIDFSKVNIITENDIEYIIFGEGKNTYKLNTKVLAKKIAEGKKVTEQIKLNKYLKTVSKLIEEGRESIKETPYALGTVDFIKGFIPEGGKTQIIKITIEKGISSGKWNTGFMEGDFYLYKAKDLKTDK